MNVRCLPRSHWCMAHAHLEERIDYHSEARLLQRFFPLVRRVQHPLHHSIRCVAKSDRTSPAKPSRLRSARLTLAPLCHRRLLRGLDRRVRVPAQRVHHRRRCAVPEWQALLSHPPLMPFRCLASLSTARSALPPLSLSRSVRSLGRSAPVPPPSYAYGALVSVAFGTRRKGAQHARRLRCF